MTSFVIAYMAPLMFAALVVFLLLGYPVAFALAAIGLSFGFLGIELGLLHPSCCKPCRSASSASCRTIPCSPCRSSPSWG